jgi:small subunit ribosomal protein S9
MAEDKTPEQDDPQEIAAEDAVGAQETPDEAQQEREQAIADEPVAETAADEAPAAEEVPAPAAEEVPAPAAEEAPAPAAEAPAPAAEAPAADDSDDAEPATPRVKPAIPGMDLEVDIVREGEDALGGRSPYDEDGDEDGEGGDSEVEDLTQPIANASIDLAAGARYRATGKRKTAVARVTLQPGTGAYTINGRTLEEFFPRDALMRTIRQPLETVGYETRMDVVATMHGGGVSSQAGALRHGISRALIEAAPDLRSELKRRGFLTRDARVKERKKAGLKKARKRPQFSKR